MEEAGSRQPELTLRSPGSAAAAMEPDGEQLPAQPALESEGLRFLHVTVGSLLAAYSWYLVFGCVLLFAVVQKLSGPPEGLQAEAAAVAPEDVVRRQEALAAARLKMQEELNAQVERHKEKLRQLEEGKRRRKIEMWDSLQEGKSYRGHARKLQEEDNPSPSTSSSLPNRPVDRKPLRGSGYNPLSGEGGGACTWRPGRRGPSSGG